MLGIVFCPGVGSLCIAAFALLELLHEVILESSNMNEFIAL